MSKDPWKIVKMSQGIPEDMEDPLFAVFLGVIVLLLWLLSYLLS